MLTQSEIKELLLKQKIKPAKRLGQNFLIDKNINDFILKHINLTKNDILIEIGAGLGNLTEPLAKKVDKVYAFEIDKKLAKILSQNLKSFKNALLIEGDFLKYDLDKIIRGRLRKVKVIGNLPYYISSSIIFRLLNYSPFIDSALIMLQKEVARRIISRPHSKDYGILSPLVQSHAEVRLLRYISKNSFYPKPKVDSALLSFKFFKQLPFKIKNEEIFLKVVKGAFSKRRKHILNALSSYSGLSIDKTQLTQLLKQLKIDTRQRAEDLEIRDFAGLANLISGII